MNPGKSSKWRQMHSRSARVTCRDHGVEAPGIHIYSCTSRYEGTQRLLYVYPVSSVRI